MTPNEAEHELIGLYARWTPDGGIEFLEDKVVDFLDGSAPSAALVEAMFGLCERFPELGGIDIDGAYPLMGALDDRAWEAAIARSLRRRPSHAVLENVLEGTDRTLSDPAALCSVVAEAALGLPRGPFRGRVHAWLRDRRERGDWTGELPDVPAVENIDWAAFLGQSLLENAQIAELAIAFEERGVITMVPGVSDSIAFREAGVTFWSRVDEDVIVRVTIDAPRVRRFVLPLGLHPQMDRAAITHQLGPPVETFEDPDEIEDAYVLDGVAIGVVFSATDQTLSSITFRELAGNEG